jgi:hypothetical protein
MRDVLEVLSKLPPACLVWEGEQAYMIRRGVMGQVEYPAPSAEAVLLWNYNHQVTVEQVAAMQAGSQLGWDMPGADITLPGGDTTYIYSAPLQVMLSVNARHEDDAARMAETALEGLVEYLKDTSQNHILTVLRDGRLDLIEEHKNG